MNGIPPIVVGYDGSAAAQAALTWAAAEAARLRSPLRVVLVLHWPRQLAAMIPGPPLYPDERVRRDGEDLVARAVAATRERFPGAAVTGRVLVGNTVPDLVAESTGALMVVLGHRGHHGFDRLLLGSVGVAVSAQAHCPVVIVRPEADAVAVARPSPTDAAADRDADPTVTDITVSDATVGNTAAGNTAVGDTVGNANRLPRGSSRDGTGADLPGTGAAAPNAGPAVPGTGPPTPGTGAAGPGTGAAGPGTTGTCAHEGGLDGGAPPGQVLVGFDGSVCAGRALGVAFLAAAHRGTGVWVLHAWHAPVPRWGQSDLSVDPWVDTLCDEPLDQLAIAEHLSVVDALQPWRRRYPGVPVSVDLVDDDAGHALIAASARAQLAVVGSCGHGSVRGLLFGSVSQRLVHHAGCPVVVVHEQPSSELTTAA